MSDKTTRCTECASEFDDLQIATAAHCPACGTTSVPCRISEDVFVRMNWHELRVLGIWASNWSAQHDCGPSGKRTLLSILHRLENQHPGKPKLTLAGEIKDLANVLGTDVEVRHGAECEVVKHEEPS